MLRRKRDLNLDQEVQLPVCFCMLTRAKKDLSVITVNHFPVTVACHFMSEMDSLDPHRDRRPHKACFFLTLVALIMGLIEFFLTLRTGEVPSTISKRDEGCG